MNQTTKSLQYDGAVQNTVMAMAEVAHGGQILIDEASFTTVKASLVQLRARVAPSPNLADLHGLCRQASPADAVMSAALLAQAFVYASEGMLTGPVLPCKESAHSQQFGLARQIFLCCCRTAMELDISGSPQACLDSPKSKHFSLGIALESQASSQLALLSRSNKASLDSPGSPGHATGTPFLRR